MNFLGFYINEFSSNIRTFESLLTNVSSEQVQWKQDPTKWSMLEVGCHLYDEEREDFRTRLKLVLETPEKSFPSIDPTGWVIERNYASQNFDKIVQLFIQERKNSIEWLKSLQSAKWDNAYLHLKLGPMSAKFIIANWLAHDYLHIRQIIKLKYDYLKELSKESLSYAGDW